MSCKVCERQFTLCKALLQNRVKEILQELWLKKIYGRYRERSFTLNKALLQDCVKEIIQELSLNNCMQWSFTLCNSLLQDIVKETIQQMWLKNLVQGIVRGSSHYTKLFLKDNLKGMAQELCAKYYEWPFTLSKTLLQDSVKELIQELWLNNRMQGIVRGRSHYEKLDLQDSPKEMI